MSQLLLFKHISIDAYMGKAGVLILSFFDISCFLILYLRLKKEPTIFLISCFHALVAERITFDVYPEIALHGFLIDTNSSNCFLFVYYKQ